MTDTFTQITLNHYLALSGILFIIGAAGVLLRRNLIVLYMGLELMLNAANLALVAFNRFATVPNLDGHIMVFFIITVAAAEVAVGLALLVALFRLKQTTNTGDLASLKF
ncbi:MAG: NADH-quinone oxidoreductase subunit NuoK [Verrucomicrobiales bacterium]|jgi:NADH-quinone oxidoreductase subunit K|nr:NADH-quinone oxidoreductase subunit NuoK [Verrucomicrobiales bacterium]